MLNQEDQDQQAEFFNDLPREPKPSFKKRFHLGRIAISLSYENLVLLTIGSIMTLIVCYSLGVEQGRQMAEFKDEEIKEVQEEVQTTPPKVPAEPKKEKMRIKVAEQQAPSKAAPYIQVASFRTDKYALREMERLKNKGYQPFTFTWGKYKVVCVGGYHNKDEAKRALAQLKKLYADCILRK